MVNAECNYIAASAYGFCSFDPEELIVHRENLMNGIKHMKFSTNVLCGTILLSSEGLNVRLSGTLEAVQYMQSQLRELHPKLTGMEFRECYSNRITLHKFLVKIKKEIISMGLPNMHKQVERNAEHISAFTFKKWMDEKRDMIVLDTRNDYEVRLGTFENALHCNLKSFRSFPDNAKASLQHVPKDAPIVMFCTGGVRCEKASCVLQDEGFEQVYQLDGGILKYFKQIGGAHYEGDCYIFDDRVAVRPDLSESDVESCYTCRSPLTADDRASHHYVAGAHCPYCVNAVAISVTKYL